MSTRATILKNLKSSRINNTNNNNNNSCVSLQQGHKIFLLCLVLWILAVAQFRAEFNVQESLLLARGQQQQQQQESSAYFDYDESDPTIGGRSLSSGGEEATNKKSSSSSSSSSSSRRTSTPHDYLIVDILSIGSEKRMELLTTQQQTFGSHVSVRHFFTATEMDDIDDPYCNIHLKVDDTLKISRFCKQRKWDESTHRLMRFLKNSYANIAWLKKKSNPVGWMCAQKRPLHGLYKVFQSYNNNNNNNHQSKSLLSSSSTKTTKAIPTGGGGGGGDEEEEEEENILPDYLIIMDDDTYFNLEQFQQLMMMMMQQRKSQLPPGGARGDKEGQQQQDEAEAAAAADHPEEEEEEEEEEEQKPYVFAGCLVRVPVNAVNFTFGFGGYGTVFNRAALQKLQEPIHCNSNNNNNNKGGQDTTTNNNNINNDNHNYNWNEEACAQVERNLIGEQKVFRSGMSVLELIKAFVIYQPYKDYRNWTDGYCMHSDWVLGYFVNHYNISSHVKEPFYANVPQARMEEWNGSLIYRRGEGYCKNDNVNNCQPDSVTCHYMTVEAMTNFTNIVKAKSPIGRFHPSSSTTTRSRQV